MRQGSPFQYSAHSSIIRYSAAEHDLCWHCLRFVQCIRYCQVCDEWRTHSSNSPIMKVFCSCSFRYWEAWETQPWKRNVASQVDLPSGGAIAAVPVPCSAIGLRFCHLCHSECYIVISITIGICNFEFILPDEWWSCTHDWARWSVFDFSYSHILRHSIYNRPSSFLLFSSLHSQVEHHFNHSFVWTLK